MIRIVRITKDPEVRKQEIIDTAMKLFSINGYEATSMTDIAKEMKVVHGLCYRYFKSKREIYEYAMNQYSNECSVPIIKIIDNYNETFENRINQIVSISGKIDKDSKYNSFYHKKENEMFHKQLLIKMCENIIPHFERAIIDSNNKKETNVESPYVTANFLVHGLIGILDDTVKFNSSINLILNTINKMIK